MKETLSCWLLDSWYAGITDIFLFTQSATVWKETQQCYGVNQMLKTCASKEMEDDKRKKKLKDSLPPPVEVCEECSSESQQKEHQHY